MFLIHTFLVVALVASGFGFVLPSNLRENIMDVRDVPCSPENMETGVSRYDCTKKTALDSNGFCTSQIPVTPGDTGCAGYCEIRLTKTYGQEVPFSQGFCDQMTTCTLTTSTSITVTNQYTINAGVTLKKRSIDDVELQAAFNIGASYSYSKSLAYTVSTAHSQQLNASQCGYFTFVPYMMGSCGTLTIADTADEDVDDVSVEQCVMGDTAALHNTANYCNSTPVKDSNGYADGVIVFVLVDCTTNALLPMDQQDPIYRNPGVSTGLSTS